MKRNGTFNVENLFLCKIMKINDATKWRSHFFCCQCCYCCRHIVLIICQIHTQKVQKRVKKAKRKIIANMPYRYRILSVNMFQPDARIRIRNLWICEFHGSSRNWLTSNIWFIASTQKPAKPLPNQNKIFFYFGNCTWIAIIQIGLVGQKMMQITLLTVFKPINQFRSITQYIELALLFNQNDWMRKIMNWNSIVNYPIIWR